MNRAGFLLAAALACVAGWHLILRGHGRGLPLITDEGEYAAAARAWNEGGLPYRDAFSQKPPNIFLIYRAAAALSADAEAPRVLAAAAALATLFVLFLTIPTSWSFSGRLAAPAAFAALAALPIGAYGFAANTEVFVNFFAALSALAVRLGAPFAAGLAAGAALMTKQTALWTLLGFAAAFASRRLLSYMTGVLVIPLAWAAYFAARGGLGAYWDAAWAGNARYASVLLMTGALQSQLLWFTTRLLPSLLLFGAPALVLTGLALRGLKAGAGRPVETLAVLWIGGAVAAALTGLFLFPHYFLQLAPALALASACGVERLRRRRWAVILVLAVWPALLAPRMFFFASPHERARTLLYPNPLFETKILGEEIKRRARPGDPTLGSGDRLHVYGSEGALFSYSGLRPATKHTLSYALTLFPKSRADYEDELAFLRAEPPRFVVWSTQPLSVMTSSNLGTEYREALRSFVLRDYRLVGRMTVSAFAGAPEFEPAAQGFRADFEADGQLFLFERVTEYNGVRL